MKKISLILLALLLLISGCGKKAPVAEEDEPVNEVIETEQEEKEENKLAEKSDIRPIAVMIDNDGDASRPHAGLEEAYLLYEMYVEGNATRIMALFKDVDTAKIGPVRSSRHYFLDYALENDAIYVHYGWSPKAQNDIPALGVNNINGVLGSDGGVFWRERKYAGDYHSAYTSIKNIKDHASNVKKYRMTTEDKGIPETVSDSEPAGDELTGISFPYAGFYTVKYTYDQASDSYIRYLNGVVHKTQGGVELKAKNIIVERVSNTGIAGDDKGRQDLKTVGSGDGYYITKGHVQKITWSKSARAAKTEYKLENGEELVLNPGQTWIQIVPPSMNLGI